MTKRTLLIVDVSPLWEKQFTGIANVVFELTKRFLAGDDRFDVRFSVFHRIVERKIIEKCIEARSGLVLRELFEDIGSLTMSVAAAKKHNGPTAALFLHIKPDESEFSYEAQLYYDFSFLSVPESHHEDTIEYHLRELSEQVHSNDRIFTISQSVANDLGFYFGFPEGRTTVALLGYHIDIPTMWDFASRLGNHAIEPYFICVGSIEPRKNVALILAWLAANPLMLRSYRFLFVGRDAWGESFAELVAEAGLTQAAEKGRLMHVGYVNEEQKTALMIGSQGLIFASLFEGFGLPVLEAMALDVPLVASCTTSVPEVLGPDGIYFDPYSLPSFDKAMRQLIAEGASNAGKDRKAALRERAETFSYDRTFQVIVDQIDHDVHGDGATPPRRKRR